MIDHFKYRKKGLETMRVIPSQTVLTLTYQTGLLSFNDAMLNKLVEDKKLTVSAKRLGNQNINVFSSEKFQFIILPQNQLQFQLTGMCSVSNVINDIQEILTALNYNLSNDVRLGFQCDTRATIDKAEYEKFTIELYSINYEKLNEKLGTTNTRVTGLKLSSIVDNTTAIEIVLEPVPNTQTYSIRLGCKFTKQEEFTTFISNFNEEYVEELVNGIYIN